MKKNILTLLICSAAVTLFSGCVKTVDGRSKAGVPWQKDKIESKYAFPVAKLMDAARAALKINGVITSEDVVLNTIEAKVNTRTVFVKVEEIDPKLSKVIVQVRTKGGSTDINLAAEMDKQIALQLQNQR